MRARLGDALPPFCVEVAPSVLKRRPEWHSKMHQSVPSGQPGHVGCEIMETERNPVGIRGHGFG